MNLGRNILWNLGGLLWITLLVILVTPILVRGLGLDAFGVWAVLTASTGYLSTLDFGLGNALIRFLAAERERGDLASTERFFRSGVTLQILQGTLAGGLLFVAAPSLAEHWFRIPQALVPDAVISFRIASVAVFLGFLIATYAALPAALRRFDVLTIRTILYVTLQYGLFVLVLRLGGGLREVVLASVMGSLIALGFLVTVARRLLPGFRLSPGWDGPSAREFLRFGRFKFVSQVSWTLMREFDRIAIGLLLPVGLVSFYAVPLRLAQRITMVVEQIASPFYPSITGQITGARTEELRAQYRVGTRLIAAVSLGAVSVLGGLAHPLLATWLGPDFARSGTWVLRILLLAYAALASFTLPSVAAEAAGRPAIPAGFLVVASLVHVPLVVVGTRAWGLPGAALGVLVGSVVLVLGAGAIQARFPALPAVSESIRDTRGALLAGAITAVAALLVSRTSFPGAGLFPFLLTLAGAGGVYALLCFLFRGLLPADVRRLMNSLKGMYRESGSFADENRLRASRER